MTATITVTCAASRRCWPHDSSEVLTRRMHHRKKYCLDGAEVEVVRPLHNTEFCAYCNRLRVTSDGKLKPCLLRTDNHITIRGKKGAETRSPLPAGGRTAGTVFQITILQPEGDGRSWTFLTRCIVTGIYLQFRHTLGSYDH